ncbi:multicopper oxidase domain-containing protein [Rhodococcus sp. H29-C3]|uniref:multicopper oxidase family protein n=1 Tax=Rhodococcus sp. H29-C3 TaxID=3046307 RepID=UPI0024BA9EBA|nr:multicopper oxidase domain-containing protein [Rhodococcus sp. H29-C3]MDJ0361956.1 multicopper oxidase domain-containing protein [Rhodococcus sp. H29-C3]
MKQLSRRQFLTGLAATPIVVLAGCGDGENERSRASTLRQLPIPPIAESTVDANGTRHFHLVAAAGAAELISGTTTATWGYNGSILGPTLRARRDETVAFTVENSLPEPTTVHWHGMHVPARFDGGPHQTIDPGEKWEPTWTIDQPSATLWYHPHPHGSSEKHVYRGLAGVFIIDDDVSDSLELPGDYGVDDVPLIIQDRRFEEDGSLDESDSTNIGLLGDTIVTNGVAGAFLPVVTESIRLRILNGSSGRLYNLGFDDYREFQLVATDGGLLREPISLSRIQISPGERVEMIVRIDSGTDSILRSFPIDNHDNVDWESTDTFGFADTFDILELRGRQQLKASSELPTVLSVLPKLDSGSAAATREFELQWFMINGQRMDMNRIHFTSIVDTTEVWTVTNVDNWPHNFHVHDAQFQIVDINGTPPPPELDGWKDTVYTPPGQQLRLALRFSRYTDPTAPYMYHCHMLMHEDQGMMGQFVVVEPGAQAAQTISSSADISDMESMPNFEGIHH